jgi:hypothetical protein
VLRTVLGILAYFLCGGLILACSGGWLSKEIASLMFAVTAAVSILAFDLPQIMGDLLCVENLLTLASACVVFGFGCLTCDIKSAKKSE